MISELSKKVLSGGEISREEAHLIASLSGDDVFELFSYANRIRSAFRGNIADLCSIISAKTGLCPEDCSYCAQSARSKAEIKTSPLIGIEKAREGALRAKNQGARRFCIVTSGKRAAPSELANIANMIKGIRDAGLLPCATLGLMGNEELLMLKEAGLNRYHHNLETSRRFFPEICRTHTYDQKLKTIEAAKEAGLSLCSGGIFGMGETWDDRVELALEIKRIGADSVPINFLVPIKGTPFGDKSPLHPLEALKIISLYRFILPAREIRICGGRLQTLGEMNALVFMAGADGLLTGDCLTTEGRTPEDDLKLIRNFGMEY